MMMQNFFANRLRIMKYAAQHFVINC